MKMHRRNLLSAAVAGVVMGLAPAAFAQQLPQVIKIGSVQPLTGSSAAGGALGKAVVDMTVKEINAAGGIAGRKVEVVYGDDGTDPARAVAESKRLIEQEKVHVLGGPQIAANAMAAAQEITKAKIVSLPFTGATSITPQVYPYGFATFYAVDSFANAMADYAIDVLKFTSIGVLTDTGAQGKLAAEAFKKRLTERGVKIAAMETADFAATDVLPQTLNLRRAGAGVILQVSSNQNTPARLFMATEEMGWKVPIISQVSALFPAQIKDIVGTNPYPSGRLIGLTTKSTTYCPGEKTAELPYVKFLKRVKAAVPDWQKLPLPLAGYHYDGVQLIKAAIEGTKSIDGPKMAAWVEANSGKIPTVVGKMSASKTNHILYGPDVFAFTARPDETVDGVSLREGCKK